MKIDRVMVLLVIVLASYVYAADNQNNPDLAKCQDALNNCALNISHQSLMNIQLDKDLAESETIIGNLTAERDYYKNLYDNIVVGNYTMRDINNLYQNITNLYQYIDNRTYNLETKLKEETYNIYITQIVLSIAITLSLLGGLTFAFFQLRNKFETSFTKIENKIQVHEEKQVNIHNSIFTKK